MRTGDAPILESPKDLIYREAYAAVERAMWGRNFLPEDAAELKRWIDILTVPQGDPTKNDPHPLLPFSE